MQPRRPTSVLVIAIFHFILGGLGLLLGLVGIGGAVVIYATPPPAAGTAAPPPLSPTQQYQFLTARLPYWKEVGLAFNAVDFLISVLMIVAGIGLVKMKPWGRTASLAYGGLSILDQIGHLIYSVFFLVPAYEAYYDTLAASGGPFPPGMVSTLKVLLVATSWLSVIGFIYPVIVLVILLRPSIKAAFRGEGEWAPREEDDRYGRRPREDEPGRFPEGYGQAPPGYGGEPDDRIGPAPQ